MFRISAHAPVTCGVDIEVPSKFAHVSSGTDESTLTPGAKRSSSVPRLLKLATASESSVAPTVTAVEMQPGAPTAFVNPLLPAAIAVAMSLERRLSIGVLRLSPSQAEVFIPLPRLMFAAAMSSEPPWLSSNASARCRPRIWSEAYDRTHGAALGLQSDAALKRVKTWIATMFASGATPFPGAPETPVALPAAI